MPPGKDMTWKTYSDAFWGGDLSSTAGYDALAKRNKEGKSMCSEFEEYLKKRSKVEADYSKALSNLAKCFKPKDEIGVLEATINKYKAELETVSTAHSGAATFFQNQSETIKKFKEEQSSRRKALEDTLHKSQSSKLSQLTKTIQCEKAYVRKSCDRDTASLSYKEISTNQQAQPKDVEKAKNKSNKAEDEAEKADSAYKSAVMVLDDCRTAWEHEMLVTCQSIQELDEERLKFLRQEIWTTINADSKLALNIDSSCESTREILEKCDIVSDIQAFIAVAGTGEEHPEPIIYRHYTNIMADKDNDSNGSNDNPYSSVEDEHSESHTNNSNERDSSTSTGTLKIPFALPKMLKKKSTS